MIYKVFIMGADSRVKLDKLLDQDVCSLRGSIEMFNPIFLSRGNMQSVGQSDALNSEIRQKLSG